MHPPKGFQVREVLLIEGTDRRRPRDAGRVIRKGRMEQPSAAGGTPFGPSGRPEHVRVTVG